MRHSFFLIVLAVASLVHPAIAATPRTFCNPIDIDYGLNDTRGKSIHRHGADPAIVLFKNRYWLFSTWDRPGYRVSDDLVSWRYVPLGPEVELPAKTYTAAGIAIIGDWLYFTEFGKEKQRVGLYRTRDPESGKWEKVAANLPPYADPCLFVDPPSGRVFMYFGLDKPIHGVELDRNTFAEIPDTRKQLMETFDPSKRIRDGWEVCTWDNDEASPGKRSTKSNYPCREGSWMTFHDGKYYLQYASPGTVVPGYADGLLTSDSPLGPFEYSQYSPISRKASGFITSAGHSCLFQDRYGNWWRAVTMLIGIHERMERRIGIYPAGFDKDGIPYTRTELGDLPITLADGPRDHLGDVHAGWWKFPVKEVTASSSLDDHAPPLAADDNIRTWWSATNGGDNAEWISTDLGEATDVRAVQINLAEQDLTEAPPAGKDFNRFFLEASDDGKEWKTVVDRRDAKVTSTHTYVEFDPPLRTRFLKLTNVHTPAGGKFAVSDLRAFGMRKGAAPPAVPELTAQRDAGDRRKATLSWPKVEGATGYLIRYGVTPQKLYQHDLVSGGEQTQLKLRNLNDQPPYYFQIDSLNASGRTMGSATVEAP
jgi:xylan 1,4-beta-xylosidase